MDNITTLLSTTENPDNIVQLLTFTWIDYTLFFLMFFVSVLIGIYFGCFGSKQDTTEEYLLGDRKMNTFPVAVSLIAGHLSGITLLGVPAEIYMYGGQYCVFLTTCILTCVIMIYVYLPPFYQMKVSGSYEYLQLRFDERIRMIALALYVIASFLYIPIVIYLPALAFNQASGMSIHYMTPVICAICIFYTTIGGLKAVVWTDTLQFIVTLVALFSVFVIGVKVTGGFGKIFELAEKGDRLDFFNMSLDPTIRTTFWGITVGLTTSWVSAMGINPSSVQRYMSVPSFAKAKFTIVSFCIGLFVTKLLTSLCGYIIYAKYSHCDPYTLKKISKPDQILPFYVMDIARDIPGLSGIFVSGVFGTALSTMSAHLNTLAGTLYEDVFYKFMPQKVTDTMANKVIKATVVISGAICVALVFLVERLGGVIQISGCFSGITSGPLLGLFTLGMVFPRATTKGALYGSCAALAIMSYIIIGTQYHFINKNIVYDHKPLSTEGCTEFNYTVGLNLTTSAPPITLEEPLFIFRLSFYWYYPIGAVLTVIIGLLVSYMSKEENEHRFNKNLYTPLVYRFVPDNPNEYKLVKKETELAKTTNEDNSLPSCDDMNN